MKGKGFIALVIIMFTFIIALFSVLGKLNLLLALCFFILLDFTLRNIIKARIELRLLYYLLLLFIFVKYVTGLDDTHNSIKSIVKTMHYGALVMVLLFVMIKNKLPKNMEIIKLTLIVFGFLLVNFISTFLTYNDLSIFIKSSLDYCKYFLLIFIVIFSRFDETDILKLLKIIMPIVVVGWLLAVFQFLGVEKFFDFFRGTYDIVERNGFYRSIGFFPHAIEFANFSAVLFCIYYFLYKYKYKLKWQLFTSVILFLNVILSGTRVTLLVLVFLLFFDNRRYLLKQFKAFYFLIFAVLISSIFIDIKSYIMLMVNQYSGTSPREYYIFKGIDVWKDNILFGIGFNTYGTWSYREATNDLIYNKYNIHNFDYFNLKTTDTFVAQLLPEFGLIGILLIVVFTIFIYNRYNYLLKINNNNKAYGYVILTCLLLTLNSSFILFDSHVGSFFWISIGLIINNYWNEKEKNVAENRV